MEKKEDIESLRKDIDYCDNAIFYYLSQRLTLCKKIGQIKKELGLPIVNKVRFEKIINEKIENYGELLDESFIRKIYDIIHEESCQIQKKL